jgi:uncharacterized protein YraI
MIPRCVVQCFVVLALLFSPSLSAFAFSARTVTHVNMRAGPGRSFHVITVLRPRTSVSIRQCTRSRGWCNVSARRHRGWVDSRYLSPSPRGRARG